MNIPGFLYGTAWKEERTRELAELALDAGFLGIDTANQRKHYFEAAVGEAVAQWVTSGGSRNELFLQTKFTFRAGQDQRLPYDAHAPIATQVAQSFASSLEHLATDYIDSYLLHGPSRRSGLAPADWEAWRAMEALVHSGQARRLGVSNVSAEQLAELHQKAEIKPAFVQNRCYASSGWDRSVRTFCSAHGIIYQGFSLLTANRKELARAPITQLAQRLACSPEEVVFRFALAVGMVPLTGTSNREHMRRDLTCSRLQLSAADVAAIEQMAG